MSRGTRITSLDQEKEKKEKNLSGEKKKSFKAPSTTIDIVSIKHEYLTTRRSACDLEKPNKIVELTMKIAYKNNRA